MPGPSAPRRRRVLFLRALRFLLPAVLLLTAAVLVHSTRRLEALAASPLPVTRALPYTPLLVTDPLAAPGGASVLSTGRLPVRFAVAPGETLSQLFEGLGLPAADALSASSALSEYVDPRKIKPGVTYAAYYGGGEGLSAFEMEVDGRGRVRLDRVGDTWRSDWHEAVRTQRTRVVQGRLETFLEEAVRSSGAEPMLAYEMSDVLEWDLDFTRDLRVGDAFEVLYEEVYLDGEYYGLGDVLALRYENRGRVLEAYRYGEDGGFYDSQGRPMRKMFLRSPLRFSRITSRFTNRRFHPILKRYRPHYGVDYGAPVGTPVRVTANGTVTFAGWDRGGGRTVKVRHPNGYLTAYLHLSGFAKGVRSGRPVRQGDIIGYVGATGLATGPHLDYRVQKGGRWINPLSIKSVPTKPLPEGEMPAFEAWRDILRSCLDTASPLPPDADRTVRLAAGQAPEPEVGADGGGVATAGRR